ncbi:MAG: recombinase family protein, partial [Acidobacteria bacterium]|nr:recombinase family protein [Acidobacteriota bacterium]
TLEYFEKLGRAGVGFVSIENQIDYSTPTGKFMLVMQGGLAELYSDNLSQEVKKGWAERRAQGLYCGALPFGAAKGEDGVPVPHPENYPGLLMAFEMAADGQSDREVAQALSREGYRTTGKRGDRRFTTSGVRGMLTNRFYLGELTDGEDGWVAGKHEPFIEQSLWDRAQEARRRRSTSTYSSRPNGKRVWSLTGLTLCWRCQERIHTQYVYRGEPRLGCYGRQKGRGCEHKSASLSVYERQTVDYLAAFSIPPDYQQRILESQAEAETKHSEIERERKRLEAQLKRAKELYEWGDFTKAEYLARRSDVGRRLDALPASGQTEADVLARLAEFLADVPAAWMAATQEQRNKLARTLFDEVWLRDKEVVAVKPRRELDPFFRLNYEESEAGPIEGRLLKRVESYPEHGNSVLVAA